MTPIGIIFLAIIFYAVFFLIAFEIWVLKYFFPKQMGKIIYSIKEIFQSVRQRGELARSLADTQPVRVNNPKIRKKNSRFEMEKIRAASYWYAAKVLPLIIGVFLVLIGAVNMKNNGWLGYTLVFSGIFILSVSIVPGIYVSHIDGNFEDKMKSSATITIVATIIMLISIMIYSTILETKMHLAGNYIQSQVNAATLPQMILTVAGIVYFTGVYFYYEVLRR